MSFKLPFFLTICVCAAQQVRGGDWPQFLGPTRDGVYAGADLAAAWPKEGPPVVWRKDIGEGFSGPAVAQHQLILFHRLNDQEVVTCLDARTGEPKWTKSYPTSYRDDFGFDEGPRATPCIAQGRIYTFGAEGMLSCLNLADGAMLWQVNTKNKFHPPKGFFGDACSPLVEGNAVLMNIGGSGGAGLVAFDKATGNVLWKCSDDAASYSSPSTASINGHRYAIFFTRAGLEAVDPADGKIQFHYPWRSEMNASVNAATPLIIDDSIFLSACYDTGAILLRVRDNGVEKVWSGDGILSNHYATSVYFRGFLYGIDGRADPSFRPAPSLRCVELKSGKVRWQDESVGPATILLAGDQLLILTESGELIEAAATPEAFKPGERVQIMPTGVRAYPALADGFLYARSKDKIFCVNLGRTKE
ncbi:MAG TPA: PQQ-binding-like beta-propeller repeat protein [Verrucomicrobiae bacterium]|jgi:outer membrane protein assembly factor BamB|nr:PQQ-binding-like beta-propeller repeat protein [Verrucomicrobiae bacterium]